MAEIEQAQGRPEVGRGLPVTRRQFLAATGGALAATTVPGFTEPARAEVARPDVAAFYFPSWHPDPTYAEWFGSGWTEWELLKDAQPRFPGHRQPKLPVWGLEDESRPDVMAQKIDAAADHGLDAFVFDWYWYPSGGLTVEITMTASASSGAQLFWTTTGSGSFSEDKSARFAVVGGEQRTYPVRVSAPSPLTALRLDPLETTGDISIDAIRVRRGGQVLVAFEFDRDGDAEGWTASHQLAPFEVADGVLTTSSTGGDPQMIRSLAQPIDAGTVSGPFLQSALEDGFLAAPNVSRLKFALMWANHDWVNLFPAHRTQLNQLMTVGGAGRVGVAGPEQFDALTDYVVEHYLTHPSYWRVDGGAFFSIYEPETFVRGFDGDLAAARAALDAFREKARDAGAGDVHLNLISWQADPNSPASLARRNTLVAELGVDSHTTYVWIHHVALGAFPETPYVDVRAGAADVWEKFQQGLNTPYFPNVTMGWDASPRTVQSDVYENLGYPFMPTMSGNEPREFEEALRMARDFAATHGSAAVTVNAWNEWTEGSYLEPDQSNGFARLAAVERVFGSRG